MVRPLRHGRRRPCPRLCSHCCLRRRCHPRHPRPRRPRRRCVRGGVDCCVKGFTAHCPRPCPCPCHRRHRRCRCGRRCRSCARGGEPASVRPHSCHPCPCHFLRCCPHPCHHRRRCCYCHHHHHSRCHHCVRGGGFAAVRPCHRPCPRCPRRHRRTLAEAESRTSHHRQYYFFFLKKEMIFLHNFILFLDKKIGDLLSWPEKTTSTMMKNSHSTTSLHQVHHDNLGPLTRPHFC
jgi:hypothetical protein